MKSENDNDNELLCDRAITVLNVFLSRAACLSVGWLVGRSVTLLLLVREWPLSPLPNPLLPLPNSLLISARTQLITAPAQSPATGAAMYTALF